MAARFGRSSRLEASPRGRRPEFPVAPAQRGYSALHADGRRAPDLRPDGGEQHRVFPGHGRAGRSRSQLDRGARLEYPGQAALGTEVDIARTSQSAAGPEQQSDGQLRGDAGRGRARNVYVAVTDRRERDDDVRRLLRRRDRRRPLGAIPWLGVGRWRQQSVRRGHAHAVRRDVLGRFQPPAALARRADTLLPDQPGRADRRRGRNRRHPLGGDLSAAGAQSDSAAKASAT